MTKILTDKQLMKVWGNLMKLKSTERLEIGNRKTISDMLSIIESIQLRRLN